MPTPKYKPKQVATKQKGIPLTVYRGLWKRVTYYTDKKGEAIAIQNYEEAREYAKAQGYSGIKVEYI